MENVRTKRYDVYERAVTAMAEHSIIRIIPYKGLWNAIKYPWHILAVTRQFLSQEKTYFAPSAQVSVKATVTGTVIVGPKATIMEGAVIHGPVYIGPDSVIGNNCLIRDNSHIGAGCIVGYSTEIKGSYIGDNCQFHMNYIGDSVIGNGCSFGAGTVLANFRFNEAHIKVNVEGKKLDTDYLKLGAIIGNNSKTGINVSVMPGIKIGPNSIVGPHVCLTDDLESNKIIHPGNAGEITQNKVEI